MTHCKDVAVQIVFVHGREADDLPSLAIVIDVGPVAGNYRSCGRERPMRARSDVRPLSKERRQGVGGKDSHADC